VLASAAAAGVAATAIRSDSTIAAFDTTVPSTQAFGDAAAVGTAAFAARRDHKHGMPNVSVTRSARSSNTILAAADRGTLIAATAAYTQTLTAAATLGAGWWCYVKNDTQDGTTVLTVDPNASETIDALTTITMYSGEARLLICDGANFFSILISGGYAKFTPTGGNFIVPAGIEQIDVVCVGSGGQGGGGVSGGTGSGGGGGGGGAVTRAVIRGSDLTAGATITVTVAAGGTGSGTPGAPAAAGANGAATTFGTWLRAGGGGGGGGGALATTSSGGGGGSMANTAATTTAGAPSSATAFGGAAASASSAPQRSVVLEAMAALANAECGIADAGLSCP
jgi:Glycine-rich domain